MRHASHLALLWLYNSFSFFNAALVHIYKFVYNKQMKQTHALKYIPRLVIST